MVEAGPGHEPQAGDTLNMLDVVVDKTGVRAAQAPPTDVDARPVVAGLAGARSAGSDAQRHAGAGPDSPRPQMMMSGAGPDSVRPLVVAQSRKAIDDSGNFRREVATPVKAVSRKGPDDPSRPRADTPPRAIPQVQLRALSDVKGQGQQPQQNLGYLAPPRDRVEVRARRGRELVIWGSVVVMIACVVALVIWFLAQ